jgi:hypothetical protein
LILDDDSFSEETSGSFQELERQPGVDGCVLVHFAKGVFYVAKIVSGRDVHGGFELFYLWKSLNFEGVVLPNVLGIASVNESGIAHSLPQPLPVKTSLYIFETNLTNSLTAQADLHLGNSCLGN